MDRHSPLRRQRQMFIRDRAKAGINEAYCDEQSVFVNIEHPETLAVGKPFRVKVPVADLAFFNKFTLREITELNNGYSENSIDDDQVDIIAKISWKRKIKLWLLDLKSKISRK
mgnify:FL=1